MRPWIYAVIALAALQFTGLSPFGTVYDLCGRTVGLVLPRSEHDVADDSIVTAMKNVTTDFNQLASIVGEFFTEADRIGPEAAAQFRFFLQEKARRSNAKLERLLDWLLAVYKLAFPVLVCLMLARGSGGGKGEALYDREERIKAVHGKHAAEHVVAQHDLSPSVSPSMDSASFYSSRSGGSKQRQKGNGKLESSKRNRSGPDLSMRTAGF